MKISRDYVTPFISLVFLMVGLSGILMFLHWFDGYTEVVHECLGLLFVICAIFHIVLNWKPLKSHFKKGVFIPAALGVIIISGLLVLSEIMYPPVDMVIVNRIVRAPIQEAFKALSIDYGKASEKLKIHGISMSEAKTIEDIWVNNNADPEKVIDLITE